MSEFNQISNIMKLCIKAKKKGYDCFCEYFANCNYVGVTIYKGAWTKESKPIMTFELFIDQDNTLYRPTEMDKAELYLNKLIRGEIE